MLLIFVLLTRFRTRIAPILRASLLLIGVNLTLAACFLHRAQAQLTEALVSLGDPFLNLAGSDVRGVQSLFLNGVEFHAQSMSVPLPWRVVLEKAAAQCQAHGGLELGTKAWEKLITADPTGRARELLGGVLRVEGDAEGLLVCLEGQGQLTLTAWVERVQRFAKTRDLALLGRPRYVRVRQVDVGQSVLLTLWSTGDLQLDNMFPPHTDAPGRDAPNLPRPPHSRRLLSAWAAGTGPFAASYHSMQAPPTLRAFYKSRLVAQGWAVLEGTEVLNATRQDESLRLHFAQDKRGESFVSLSLL